MAGLGNGPLGTMPLGGDSTSTATNYSATVTFAGTGTLSANGASATVTTVGLGTGQLGSMPLGGGVTGTANNAFTANVTLSGTGALTPTGASLQRSSGTATLTGAGSLTAAGTPRFLAQASLVGTGVLGATGDSNLTVAAVATLRGTGTLSASGAFIPVTPVVAVPTPKLTSNGRNSVRNLTGYSVQEDATPLDISSTEGGVGTISFGLAADDRSILLFDSDIELNDEWRGTTSGRVTKIGISGGLNSVTADSRLGALVSNTRAKPISGTFESVARYYLSLGSIVNDVYVDPALANIPVSAQGWEGDAWLNLKQLAATHRAEVTLIGHTVTLRPARTVLTNVRHSTDFNVNLEQSDIARSVEITYYDNIWVEGELIYPRTSAEQGAAQVYQVEAGQILEDDIELTASVESVLQPICVDDVAKDYSGDQSVYSVRAVDNTQVTAQNWAAGGGKVELSINSDTKTLHIKITGSSDQYRGPYRIAGRMKELTNANTTIIPPGSTDNPATAPAKAAATTSSQKSTSTTTSVDYPKATNDYPWKTAPVNGLSPLRYSYRDCVDFVAWRINRDSGHTKAPWKWTWANLRKTNGNAIGWKHDWELHGWKTGITPVPGCIAWFGSSAGAYGHVAYVQAVDTDNKTVHLEEYNWGAKQAYHTRTIKWSSVGSFLESPAGSTKTIVQNTTVKDAKEDAQKAALAADAEANKAFANPAESETDYASLRIVGTGVLIDPQILTLPTGVAADRTATEVGVTVANQYVSTIEDAYRAGVYVASRYTGEVHTIDGALTDIAEPGDGPGTIIYRKIEEFNRVYNNKTIADFDAEWAGKTIADFNAAQQTDTIATMFDNQIFGNVAGARFKQNAAYWRINNATTSPTDIAINAERDTMIQDFNETHAGKTIADFNARYAGMTMKQFGRIPLLEG
jgi:surface antigen